MSDLRAAIIGYGLSGAVFHGPLLNATPGVTVTTVLARDPQKRAAAERAHPGVTLVDTDDALFARAADGDLDLIVVAAPNAQHVPLARRAIEQRIPVVVDKPLAIDAHAALELAAYAHDQDVLLVPFQNRRWDADQLTLRALIGDGRLGEVRRYESRMERWVPERRPGRWREATAPEEGGGVRLDLGSHLVDQALALFGPAAHVFGEVAARRPDGPDDDVFIAITHANGVESHLWASLVCPKPGPRLRVIGSKAVYELAPADRQEDLLRAGAQPRLGVPVAPDPPEAWGTLTTDRQSETIQTIPGDWTGFYPAVVAAIRDDEQQPPVAARDAVAALAVLDAAKTSAAEHRVVTVPRP